MHLTCGAARVCAFCDWVWTVIFFCARLAHFSTRRPKNSRLADWKTGPKRSRHGLPAIDNRREIAGKDHEPNIGRTTEKVKKSRSQKSQGGGGPAGNTFRGYPGRGTQGVAEPGLRAFGGDRGFGWELLETPRRRPTSRLAGLLYHLGKASFLDVA